MSNLHAEAQLNRKLCEFLKLLNIYLNLEFSRTPRVPPRWTT
jgi:hypothetical protein